MAARVTAERIGEAGYVEGIDGILTAMRRRRFISVTNKGAFVLTRDLAAATVFDLYQCLNLTVCPDAGDDGVDIHSSPYQRIDPDLGRGGTRCS